MDSDILSQLGQIIETLEKAQNILVAFDKKTCDPNMSVTDWNQTPNGRVIGLIGDAIELIDTLEV